MMSNGRKGGIMNHDQMHKKRHPDTEFGAIASAPGPPHPILSTGRVGNAGPQFRPFKAPVRSFPSRPLEFEHPALRTTHEGRLSEEGRPVHDRSS